MIAPGQTCENCGRRVPHEKKPSTPKTKPFHYHAPADDADSHREVIEVTAEFLGVHTRPYWMYWLVTYACARVLQDEDMRGIGASS